MNKSDLSTTFSNITYLASSIIFQNLFLDSQYLFGMQNLFTVSMVIISMNTLSKSIFSKTDTSEPSKGGKYEHVITEHILGNLSTYCSVGGTFTWQVNEALGKVRKAVARVEHMLQDRADQYMEQQ